MGAFESFDGNVSGRRLRRVGRQVVTGRAEGCAESVDGLPLEAEPDTGVDAGGDADVGVAEEFLDHNKFDALLQKQSGGRVPEVVEADAAEASLAEERGQGAGEVARVDRSALGCGEHVPVVLPRGACGPHARAAAVPWWSFSEWTQRPGRAMRSSGARVLVGSVVSPPAAVRCKVRRICGGARIEVEVFPAQAEKSHEESGILSMESTC